MVSKQYTAHCCIRLELLLFDFRKSCAVKLHPFCFTENLPCPLASLLPSQGRCEEESSPHQESGHYIWGKFCTYYWTPISLNLKRRSTCYQINSISFYAWSYENRWIVGGRSIVTREKSRSKLSYPSTSLTARQEGSMAALLYRTQMNDGWTELSGLLIYSLIISEIDQGKAIPFLSDKKYSLTSLY